MNRTAFHASPATDTLAANGQRNRAHCAALACVALLPYPAAAHEVAAVTGGSPALEVLTLAALAVSLGMYAWGVRRLWRRAGTGRGISAGHVARFAAGWLVLAAALLSPIDTLGAALFSMHMVQHELLMVVAAPLLVLSRPLEAWTWALPRRWRRSLATLTHARFLRMAWGAATRPAGAWLLHALAVWGWHVPWIFEAALVHEGLHALQHACFLGTALLFWWSILGRGLERPDAAPLASVFTTALHTGALAALLTFAPQPWYAHYAGAAYLGLTALDDQQLGGLVMWVPGGLAYLVAGLAIAAAWLRPEEVRQPLR